MEDGRLRLKWGLGGVLQGEPGAGGEVWGEAKRAARIKPDLVWIRSSMIRVVRLRGQALSPFVCLSSLHLLGLFVAIGRRFLVFARGAVI
jgi:hypothetical protein